MRGTATTIAAVGVVLASAWADEPADGPPRMKIDQAWRPAPGDIAEVHDLGATAVIGYSYYSDFDKYRLANDQVGMKRLLDDKRAAVLPKGTKVLVLKSHLSEYRPAYFGPKYTSSHMATLPADSRPETTGAPLEVRIQDGPRKDIECFIDHAEVARLIPDPAASKETPPAKSKGKPATKAVDPSARARSLLNLAKNSKRNGKPDVAAEYYRRIVKEFPGSPEAKTAADELKNKP